MPANPRRSSEYSLLFAAASGALSAGILTTANDLVAVLALGASTAQIGVLNALESISYLLLSVPAGWVLDRYSRRLALLGTQGLSTICLLIIPVLWSLGLLEFWHLALCSFVVGTAAMVWSIGISTTLAIVTPKNRIASAFSRLQAVQTSAGIVSPGATGTLLMFVAAPIALYFAAVFEFLAGLLLVLGKSGDATPKTGTDRSSLRLFPGFVEGFSFVVRTKPIFYSIATSATTSASLALMSAVETYYLVQILKFSPIIIGFVGVVIALSALAGAVLGSWLLARFEPLQTACIASIVGTSCCPLLPLSSLAPTDGVVPLIMVLLFSASWNITAVISASGQFGVTAILTPEALMGRVQSVRKLLGMGPVPIFSLLGGAMGVMLGSTAVLWIFVALALVSTVLSIILLRISRAWPES